MANFIIRYDAAGKFRLETESYHGDWAPYDGVAVLCVPTSNGGHRKFVAVSDFQGQACLPANKALEVLGEFDAEVRDDG